MRKKNKMKLLKNMATRLIISFFACLLLFSCEKHEKQKIIIDYKSKTIKIEQPTKFVIDSISILDDSGLKYNIALMNKRGGSSFIDFKQINKDYKTYLNSMDSLNCESEINIILRRKDYEKVITHKEASNFKFNKNIIVVEMVIYNHCLKDLDTLYSVSYFR
jgi:hypothetical protein